MDWADFKRAEDLAWEAFFDSLSKNGISRQLIEFIEADMDSKDVFNDVSGCIFGRVRFEEE